MRSIQRFLDGLDYDVRGQGCRWPRRVLRERTVQCMDGALLGAAALRLQGHRPLIVDLEAVFDDVAKPVGMARFAELRPARGGLFSARGRAEQPAAPDALQPAVPEEELT